MSDAKFTKGPWFISRKSVVGPRDQEDGQSYGMIVGVADVYGENRSTNAHLIAAAPDLYKALERCREELEVYVSLFGKGLYTQSCISEVNRALAKSRGEL